MAGIGGPYRFASDGSRDKRLVATVDHNFDALTDKRGCGGLTEPTA